MMEGTLYFKNNNDVENWNDIMEKLVKMSTFISISLIFIPTDRVAANIRTTELPTDKVIKKLSEYFVGELDGIFYNILFDGKKIIKTEKIIKFKKTDITKRINKVI